MNTLLHLSLVYLISIVAHELGHYLALKGMGFKPVFRFVPLKYLGWDIKVSKNVRLDGVYLIGILLGLVAMSIMLDIAHYRAAVWVLMLAAYIGGCGNDIRAVNWKQLLSYMK